MRWIGIAFAIFLSMPLKAEIPPIVRKYAEGVAANPADQAAWNRLELAVARNHLLLWRFDPDVPFEYRKDKDGKPALVVSADPKELDSGKDALASWMSFAMTEGLSDKDLHDYADSLSYDCACPEALQRFATQLTATARIWRRLQEKNPNEHDPYLDLLAMVDGRGDSAVLAYIFRYRPEKADAAVAAWAGQNRDRIVRFMLEVTIVPREAPPPYARKLAAQLAAPHANASFRGNHGSGRNAAEERESATKQLAALDTKLRQLKETEQPIVDQALVCAEMAVILNQLGREAEARHVIDEALQSTALNPADATLHLFLDVIRMSITAAHEQGDPSNVEVALKMLQNVNHQEVYIESLRLAARIFESSGRYGQAAAWFQQSFRVAKTIGSSKLQNQALLSLGRLYDLVFESICWNVSTGRINACRSTDFTNDTGIDPDGNNYGSRSPEEDSATFATAFMGQQYAIPQRKPYYINQIARAELAKGNPALALKCLYYGFVFLPYSIATIDRFSGSATVNGVSVDSKRLAAAYFARELGDPGPVDKLFEEVGLRLEEDDMSDVDRLMPQPVEGKPLDFEEVEAGMRLIQASGGYVPDRFFEIEENVHAAWRFEQEIGLDSRRLLEAAMKEEK